MQVAQNNLVIFPRKIFQMIITKTTAEAGYLASTAMLIVLAFGTSARAQESSNAQLQQQIDALRGRLADMDQLRVELEKLEIELKAQRRPSEAPSVPDGRQPASCPACSVATAHGPNLLSVHTVSAEPEAAGASAGSRPASIFPDARNTTLTQNAFAAGGQNGTVRIGALDLTVGGFVEVAGIVRSRNEAADTGASGATEIPLPQNAKYHESESQISARSSRLAFLAQDQIGASGILAAYVETDFFGSSDTSNGVQTNSYQPRLRHAFGAYENYDLGLQVLGGQTWSLITPNTKGVFPPNELVTATIDLSLTAGYLYNRQAQIRVAKDLGHGLWLAASVENAATVYYVGPNGATGLNQTVTTSSPGSGGFDSQVNYSDNIAPDFILKAALDSPYGHYELFGVAREFTTRVSTAGNGTSRTVAAGGGGGDFYVSLGSHLTAQGSLLVGSGVGRYAAAAFPDATVGPDGEPAPLREVAALVGLVGRPSSRTSVYTYVGTESVARRSFEQDGKAYGYGNPLYVNSGCWTEASPAACTGNTSRVLEATTGGWWRLLKSGPGNLQAGLQYSFTRRSLFDAVGGGGSVNENAVYIALRYSPLQ